MESMNWADFLNADTNSRKLKDIVIVIVWAWSEIDMVF